MRWRILAAFAVLIAVIWAIGLYLYGFTSGVAYLIGYALVPIAILGANAAFIARWKRRPVRWDVVFGSTAILLVVSSYQQIAATYDLRQFQSEVRAASPDNVGNLIQRSSTRTAALLRTMLSVAVDTNLKIMIVLNSTDDPIFDGLFDPPKVIDRTILAVARSTALKKISAAKATMASIDQLMQEEIDKLAGALSEYSDLGVPAIEGVKARHATVRPLYARQANLNAKALDVFAQFCEFLLVDAGSYTLGNNRLIFPSSDTVSRYNSHLSRLKDLAAEQSKIDEDMAAYRKYAATQLGANLTNQKTE